MIMRLEAPATAITFRQLRMFESVGRLKSFRRGSEECNRSQPAVTQAVGKLEQQLGASMLERRANGSYLTDAGHIMHRRVTRMFDQFEQALLELDLREGQAAARAIVHRLSISQVRGLLAIIACGSFAGAAMELGLTPAAVQRAARDLESNLRKPIFLRTASGLMVTQTGIRFARRLKLALQEVQWGIEEIEATLGDHESRIVIGTLPFGGNMLLADVLEKFLIRQPRADIRIMSGGAAEMMKHLRGGDVDLVIGLIQDTSAQDFVSHPLVQTPYSIVARRHHPLLRAGPVTLDMLAAQEWIVGSEGSTRRACFEALFAGRAMPRTPIATSAIPVIRHLLRDSNRLTLMTSYELAQPEHADPGKPFASHALTTIPFSPMSTIATLGITRRADWLPTSLHEDFIDLLRSHVASNITLRRRDDVFYEAAGWRFR